MTKKTITRLDIAKSISQQTGLKLRESSKHVDSIIRMICDGLDDGKEIKITNFGTFKRLSKSQRIGRVPKTGQEIIIPPRYTATFYASNSFKSRLYKKANKPK